MRPTCNEVELDGCHALVQDGDYQKSKLMEDIYPDFVMMAKSFGVPSKRVTSPEELRPAIRSHSLAFSRVCHGEMCPVSNTVEVVERNALSKQSNDCSNAILTCFKDKLLSKLCQDQVTWQWLFLPVEKFIETEACCACAGKCWIHRGLTCWMLWCPMLNMSSP